MIVNIICDTKSSWFYWFIDDLKSSILKLDSNIEVFLLDNTFDIQDNSDISFFLSCEKIVKKEVFSKSNNNIVIHASDLPKWKWMSPMTWQILEWLNIIPITLFEMDEKIDNWKWYIKDNLILDGSELLDEIQQKLYLKIKEMASTFVSKYPHNDSYSQIWEETFYKRRSLNDSQLDIDKTIQEQFNLLRVVDNDKYPAFFMLNGNKYLLRVIKETND